MKTPAARAIQQEHPFAFGEVLCTNSSIAWDWIYVPVQEVMDMHAQVCSPCRSAAALQVIEWFK